MNNKNRGFFITGTDTDIGKTYCARLLCDTFAEKGPVTYMKPVQTGCARAADGSWVIPDYEYVMQGKAVPVLAVDRQVPYSFEPACSPHLAARRAGCRIEIAHIVNCYREIEARHEGIVIVEGAGGILVPLNDRELMVDCMRKMNLPVVLVTSPRLGTLNHTLMSMEALRKHGCTLAGVVITNSTNIPQNEIYADNIDFITKANAPVPVIALSYNTSIHETLRTFCDGLRKRYCE